MCVFAVLCGVLLVARGLAGEGAAPKADTAGQVSRGTESAFTVHLDRSAGTASPLLYGLSLPAPGSPEGRLLSPELLRNGSFELAPPGKAIPLPQGWAAAKGWHLASCGPKRIIVRSELGEGDPLVLVGNRLWKNYHISLLARKTGGPGGFQVLFEVRDAENHVQWTLGAGGNQWHVLESVGRGRPRDLAPPVVGRIEPGRAYRIDISVRDRDITCSLDGRLIHRLAGAQFPTAGLGLGAADATAEYLDLTVRSAPEVPLFLLDEPVDATKDGVSAGWEPACSPGNVTGYKWEFVYPANSQFSQRIGVDKYAGGDAGIRQRGIPVEAGAALRGRIALRGTVGLAALVSLRGRDGTVYAQQELRDIRAKWTDYDLNLVPSGTDPAAEFCLSVTGTGTVWTDGASLIRGGDFGPLGVRREVADALRALRPAVLRWPTGLAAPNYDWRRGLGPIAERPIAAIDPRLASPAAEGKVGTVGQAKVSEEIADDSLGYFDRGTEVHGMLDAAPEDFGIDEFLALAKELGAAPLLVANPLLGIRPNTDLVEYCNGAAATIFGKRRVANGHAEPYGVRLWHVPLVGAPEKDAKTASEPRLSLPKALREQDAKVRVIEGHRDWVPGPAAGTAATLNRLAREGGAEGVATCPWVAPAKAPAEGLLSGGSAGIRTSPAYLVFQLFRGHAVQGLCAVEGPATPSKVDLLAGRCDKELVIRAANCGEAEVKIAVGLDGLGQIQLPAKAEHFRIRGDGEPHIETEAVPVAANKLVFTSPPRSVHVLVLRLP